MLNADPAQYFTPNNRAKHKVPTVLSRNNPTQEHKPVNKKGKERGTNSKRPCIDISESDTDSDDNDVFDKVLRAIELKKNLKKIHLTLYF